MSRKAYPEYEPSGIDWLGELPVHWRVRPLKRTFKILNGSTPKSSEPDYWDGDIPWATPDDLGSLKGDTLHATRRMITQEGYESCGTSLAPAGSLVLSTRAPIGHLAIAGVPLCTNQGCRCLVFRNKDEHRFFYYQLLAAKEELESWGQGSTFKELGRDKLSALCFLCPPFEEQRAIAAFLDRETTRFDALIEKKQRQIQILREKRAALISHAVTKGLDPNAKMKDSGIEWLGQIPAHWEAKRIKHAVVIRGGQVDPRQDEYAKMILVAPNHIESGTGRILGLETAWDQGAISGKYLFRKGDVLYSKIRPELAKACLAPEDGLCSADMYAMVPRSGIATQFVLYLLLSDAYTKLAVDESMRVAMPKINREDLGEIRWPFPPEPEQEHIVDAIEKQIAPIDRLRAKIRLSIEELHEYRTALISAAVTGKIDVRSESA